jgi:nitroreductase
MRGSAYRAGVDVDEAIRTRRTTKAFGPEPVGDDVLRELLELAVLAPNHHATEPWRFWVVGRPTIDALIEATGDQKLGRSPRAIVAGVVRSVDPHEAEEDYAAVACAIQNLLLASRGRGLANFWRTPGVMNTPAFRSILQVPDAVRVVGVVHLGQPAEPHPVAPERTAAPHTSWLP